MARIISICNQKGGVGKCVAPETPVQLASGEVFSIKEIYDRYSKNALVSYEEGGGTFSVPSEKLEVLSVNDDLKIQKSPVQCLYKGVAARLMVISTQKGKSIRVTTVHPFLVLKDNALSWIAAQSLRKGEYIGVPREVCLKDAPESQNFFHLLNERILVRVKHREFIERNLDLIMKYPLGLDDKILNYLLRHGETRASSLRDHGKKTTLFAALRKLLLRRIISRKRTGRTFVYYLNRDALLDYLYSHGFSVRVLQQLSGDVVCRDVIRDFIYKNASGYCSKAILPVFLLDEGLAVFVSMVIAECSIDRSRIILYNTSGEIIDFFLSFVSKLGLTVTKERFRDEWKITVHGAGTFNKILHDIFEVPLVGNGKSSRVTLPNIILKSTRRVLGAYLGAYVSCEGYVAKDRTTLEITSASKQNITRLHYAFLRLGLNGSITCSLGCATNSKLPKKRRYYSLTYTGAPAMRTLLSELSFVIQYKKERLIHNATFVTNTNLDVIPVGTMLKPLRQQYNLLQKELGLQGTVTDYEDGSVNPSRTALQKIVAVMSNHSAKANEEWLFAATLSQSDLFWEKIESIEVEEYSSDVYDLTVADTHNFLAGTGALVVHNTTTSMNLSAYLAVHGYRTLLVDFDPQYNASSGLGVIASDRDTVYHALLAGEPVHKTIKSTQLSNLHVMPASPDLAGALIELVGVEEREWQLRKLLDTVREKYDYILIDLAPSLNLLTINGLIASDEVLIPVQCEYYSLEGLSQLLDTVELINTNLGHPLRIAGALLTMYDKREKLSREVSREIRRRFPHHVYTVEIPRSVSLAEAPSFRKPVLLYAPQSIGALAYERLAREVLEQAGEKIIITAYEGDEDDTSRKYEMLRLI